MYFSLSTKISMALLNLFCKIRHCFSPGSIVFGLLIIATQISLGANDEAMEPGLFARILSLRHLIAFFS